MELKPVGAAFMRLVEIMHILRGPEGCPWDAEQTPESLCPYMIEETYEAVAAIESGRRSAICDELGDMLLQVVFQAELFREQEAFDITDVCRAISDKMVRRHPHVFAGLEVADMEQLLTNWDQIKRAEGATIPASGSDIPRHLPALARAVKLVGRARRQQRPLPPAPSTPPRDAADLGQQLLALCRWAAEQGVDAEQALRQALAAWSDAPTQRP